jgi:hypothetical protein
VDDAFACRLADAVWAAQAAGCLALAPVIGDHTCRLKLAPLLSVCSPLLWRSLVWSSKTRLRPLRRLGSAALVMGVVSVGARVPSGNLQL